MHVPDRGLPNGGATAHRAAAPDASEGVRCVCFCFCGTGIDLEFCGLKCGVFWGGHGGER